VIATYEHSRHTFTIVQGRRAHMCRPCVRTHALWALSHSSLSSHTNVDSARKGNLAKGKSFGQRSLDNRASSYRRASLRRGKDADKEGKEDRKVGRRKWRRRRKKLALLQSQLAHPRGNHSSLREPSGLEIVRKRLPGCVLGGVFFPPSIA